MTPIEIALGELGVSEPSARIAEYFQSTWMQQGTYKSAWCAAFVSWCIGEAGHPNPNIVGARNFYEYGRDTSVNPHTGDVVVIRHRNGRYHVGFYIHTYLPGLTLLGGNQGNSVCVRRYDADKIVAIRRGVWG